MRKALTCLVLCLLTVTAAAASQPEVLIVGQGFFGRHHLENLTKFEQGQHVKVIGVVDSNPDRLKGQLLPTFTTVDKALKSLSPTIVAVVTNTGSHFDILQQVFDATPPDASPHLFVEKPLVEHVDQAKELSRMLYERGYDKERVFSCGYLFRSSEPVRYLFHLLEDKLESLAIESIEITWIKERLPTRPSAGVHMDEATHGIDLARYILGRNGFDSDSVEILRNQITRSSAIIDTEQQRQLYGNDPDMLNPVASTRFEMKIGGIPVSGWSSFENGPQERKMVIHFNDGTLLTMGFDHKRNNNDYLHLRRPKQRSERWGWPQSNKLFLEWSRFLAQLAGEGDGTNTVSPADALFDVEISAALGRDITQPGVKLINRFYPTEPIMDTPPAVQENGTPTDA